MAWLGVCAAVASAAVVATGSPSDRSTDHIALPTPGSEAWKPLLFPRVSRQTRYSRRSIDGVDSLVAESNCAASGLVLPLREIEIETTPILSWRWRVVRGLDIPNERARDGDDFAARVYVMFELDPSRASFFSKWRHRIGSALYGREAPGSALNFVWTSTAAPGESWDNPFASNAKMIALANGTSDVWKTEQIDVIEQYRAHFGNALPPLMGIAVMSDSDNSCQSTQAQFAEFTFGPRAAGGTQDDI